MTRWSPALIVAEVARWAARPAPGPRATPAEVHRWRLDWPERADAAELARLRQRSQSGEAAADLAVLDAQVERREAARLRAQVERIAAERAHLGLAGEEPAALERASRYLAVIPGGRSGQGRSNDAIKVVFTVLQGFALTEGMAFDLLAREYAPRCSPPWPPRVLAGMVRRAARAPCSRPGWLLAR